MFYYKDYISLNSKFSKSTNIVYDTEDCENYIITKSAKNVLKVLFKLDYHNSISLIGPFGCGKSSLLLYINTLLSNTKNSDKCLNKLHSYDQKLYEKFKRFIESKNFLRVKIVGEHISFKEQLKTTLLEIKELKSTIKYLKENDTYQLSKALEYINKDIEKSKYTDILFSIDEFGKFIEYGFDDVNSNDIFDLQTLSEFVNKKSNYKLIVSLHKAFSEYTQGINAGISYTDWDKIQGRFENIVFKDDYYEMLNIFKETIVLNNSTHIDKCKKIVEYICNDESFKKNIDTNDSKELFEQIIPIHPYSVLVIAEIFTKYFQNQRSIYSFIFSSEPSAFQEFIYKEHEKYELYSLADLYDYVAYLLKVYSILLPDREVWYFSEYRLNDNRIKNTIQTDIIKTISLIHTFKLINVVLPNKEHIVLSLIDKYEKEDILENIQSLEENNILVYQEQNKSFSLLEDSNIDINKEMKNILSRGINIDYEKSLNSFIKDKYTVAKRYFSNYGNKKIFEKKYVSSNLKILEEPYKIFLVDTLDEEVNKYISNNQKSIFIPLKNSKKLNELIEKIEALHSIKDINKDKISIDTNDIIENMIIDYTLALENILNENYLNSMIYFNSTQYEYSSKNIQMLISTIAEVNYSDTPILNNYTLNHTIANKGSGTTAIKMLFDKLLTDWNKPNLGIEKYPAEKALYLSIIKPSGVHREVKGKYILSEPNSLNLKNIWKFIEKTLSKKINVVNILSKLEKEPYGLNKTSAMFIVSLFIIVNQDKISIFRSNTYTYNLTLDLLMNMWKATDKYELQLIKLSNEQKNLFKAYVQITTDITDYEYSKDKVVSIIKTLYTKFSKLPEYSKNTLKISEEAIALRSALNSMKEPTEAFFEMFPKALGYKDLESIKIDEFIIKFKSAFNEIALSYKGEIIVLEKYLTKVFYLETKTFPYNNSLVELSNKLSKVNTFDSTTKALIRSFTYANSTLELIDSISVILINKKLDKCYDNDITVLKDKLSNHAKDMLSKLELADIVTGGQDVRKVSLSSLESNLNKVISINKNKIDTINNTVNEIKKKIPASYTNDEKLYLISQLLNEELLNE